jgi:hypothetical protein
MSYVLIYYNDMIYVVFSSIYYLLFDMFFRLRVFCVFFILNSQHFVVRWGAIQTPLSKAKLIFVLMMVPLLHQHTNTKLFLEPKLKYIFHLNLSELLLMVQRANSYKWWICRIFQMICVRNLRQSFRIMVCWRKYSLSLISNGSAAPPPP